MNRTQQAIQHFLHGFGFLQQYTTGFKTVEDGPFPYFIRPGGESGRYEFLVYKTSAEEVVPSLSAISPTHSICFFPEGNKSLQSYKDRGYRQRFTEYLMQLDLRTIPAVGADFSIQRATSPQQLAAMSQAKGWGRKYEVAYLRHDNVYSFYIEQAGQVVSGGNLLLLYDDDVAYVEDVFTVRSHQHQGLGSALMGQMLQVAAAQGIRYSTLVSFASARAFYEHLGYAKISDLKYLSIKA
jgi:GNAT superfamily N-acetyltransferase